MKKWVVYLILHSFLVLCACQPTPEQPAITEKQNTGSFLEQAGMQENGKHFRDMDIPDGKYVLSTTGRGGRRRTGPGRWPAASAASSCVCRQTATGTGSTRSAPRPRKPS